MKNTLSNAAAFVAAFVIVPLGLGWAALIYINNLLKSRYPKDTEDRSE